MGSGPKIGYNPIFDWTELRNDKGERLLIGVDVFDSANTSFVDTIPCLEVQAGLAFMVRDDIYIVTIRGCLYSLHFNSYNPNFWMVFIHVDLFFSLFSSTYFCEFLRTTAQGGNRFQKISKCKTLFN